MTNEIQWVGLPSNEYLENYVITHIGVQMPQSPYITQCEISDMNSIVGFATDTLGSEKLSFKINANEILEFGDMERKFEHFYLATDKPLDAYTIIDIGFKEKE